MIVWLKAVGREGEQGSKQGFSRVEKGYFHIFIYTHAYTYPGAQRSGEVDGGVVRI